MAVVVETLINGCASRAPEKSFTGGTKTDTGPPSFSGSRNLYSMFMLRSTNTLIVTLATGLIP